MSIGDRRKPDVNPPLEAVKIMKGNAQFELGMRIAQLDSKIAETHAKVELMNKSLDELKVGIWQRVENHSVKLPVLEDRIDGILNYARLAIGAFIFQLVAAICYLIFKR